MAKGVRDTIAQPVAARPLESLLRGEAQSTASITVRIERRSVGTMDRDNLFGSAKFIIDALCTAGLIPGDDPGAIALEVTQKKVRHRRETGTHVEIQYP